MFGIIRSGPRVAHGLTFCKQAGHFGQCCEQLSTNKALYNRRHVTFPAISCLFFSSQWHLENRVNNEQWNKYILTFFLPVVRCIFLYVVNLSKGDSDHLFLCHCGRFHFKTPNNSYSVSSVLLSLLFTHHFPHLISACLPLLSQTFHLYLSHISPYLCLTSSISSLTHCPFLTLSLFQFGWSQQISLV